MRVVKQLNRMLGSGRKRAIQPRIGGRFVSTPDAQRALARHVSAVFRVRVAKATGKKVEQPRQKAYGYVARRKRTGRGLVRRSSRQYAADKRKLGKIPLATESEGDIGAPGPQNVHPNCQCEIIEGVWTLGYSKSGPCPRCVELKAQHDAERKAGAAKTPRPRYTDEDIEGMNAYLWNPRTRTFRRAAELAEAV